MKFYNKLLFIQFFFLINLYYSRSKSIKNPKPEEIAKGTSKIKEIVKPEISYTKFIEDVNEQLKINKEGFKKAIEELVKLKKVTAVDIDYAVQALKPTQDEIGMIESLRFPLTDEASATKILKCENGSVEIGSRILTVKGEYIIDGHHRWSQVYAINPDCKIKSSNIAEITDAIAALKASQLAIVVDPNIEKIPSKDAQGVNLLGKTLTKENVISKVKEYITNDVVKIFENKKDLKNKEDIAYYIWKNIKSMRRTSQPVTGAPNRSLMPQTDKSKNSMNNMINIQNLGNKKFK